MITYINLEQKELHDLLGVPQNAKITVNGSLFIVGSRSLIGSTGQSHKAVTLDVILGRECFEIKANNSYTSCKVA